MNVSANASDAFQLPIDGRSLVRGADTPPLSSQTIDQLLTATVEQFAEQKAVVFCAQGIRRSWREFALDVEKLAVGLHRLGLSKGDRVGIWSPNRYEWVLTQFATAQLGIILVNLNPAYRLHEIEYALNKVGCKAVITAARFKTSQYVQMIQTLAPELADCTPGKLKAARLPELRWVIQIAGEPQPGILDFERVSIADDHNALAAVRAIKANLQADDPINIQFTSGTTGSPKGATLTHRNIVNNARYSALAMRLTHADSLAIPVPLYHCFGMVMGSLICVSTGATMVFPSEGFEAEATLEAVEAERCTALHGVPTMFIAEMEHPEFGRFDLSSLRTGIMAGSPCPIEVMRKVVRDMHLNQITIAYGMTETSPISFQSKVDDDMERRVTTVGRVQPHLEVKIVDASGETVPVGVTGELCTRGYSVMIGYWNDPERTREAVSDDWMRTGDLATIDSQGYCNIVGRVKDMLIRGGENVYPREIEEFLFAHPKIQQVQAFGVPDPRMGEEVCVWIIFKPGETASAEEIIDYCRGQIAHYKIPRYVRFVTEMPMTVTGKMQKFAMREAMMKELGLVQQASA